jgi:hypothetical protein
MRPLTFALTILLTASAFAQQPQSATAPITNLRLSNKTFSGDCPVRLTATQNSTPQTLWTIALEDKGKPIDPASQATGSGVHVELKYRDHNSAIAQADLSVHFVSGDPHALPVADAHHPPEHSKTFHLTGGDTEKLAGDLFVGLVGSIRTVHLTSLSYADGYSWHATPGHACVVEPNRLILVDEK